MHAMSPSPFVQLLLAGALIFGAASQPSPMATAPVPEEGMWTFDNLPLKALKEKYGFVPTQEWIDHVRASAVKFASEGGGGGSSSFVSPNGLLMTNHHVAMETLQLLYNKHKDYDYVAHGFSAKAYGSEVDAPGFTLKVLLEIKDVTKDVGAKVKDVPAGNDRAKAKAAYLKELEEKHTDAAKRVIAEAVTFYQGSVHQIYVYRQYHDVKLVFAPEKQVAFYGGDFDNFTYPRYCLDVAFFRVYEDGKPIDTSKNYFKWSVKGAQKDELVFVPGNPGSTSRLMTHAEMTLQRDVVMPANVGRAKEALAQTKAMMDKSESAAKELRDQYFGISNTLKAWEGQLRGLRDADMMAKHQAEEEAFVKAANDAEVTAAFAKIAKAQDAEGKLRTLVPYYRAPGLVARFDQKPTKFQQFIAAVREGKKDFDGKLEMTTSAQSNVAASLEAARQKLPKDDPFVKAFLNGKSGEEAAASFAKSKLFDDAYRGELLKGGAEALAKSDDALVVALRDGQAALDALAAFKKAADDAKGGSYDVIAAARFKVFGTSMYPDATFTLRLSYGTCTGYEAGTTQVPWKTTLTGLYERNTSFDNAEPFDLPKRWLEGKSKLALETPYNFVCTTDIIGGNSGSPIINRAGEVVGLVFDGNIESLPGAYWFDERVNRTVAVHTAGITESIDKIYGEAELVKELTGAK
jgi:hypothetical protein